MAGSQLTRRILARLEHAEAQEPNPHLRDDYRIASITVYEASRGSRHAHVLATERVLGLHPDKVWSAITARRKAKLGRLYEQFFGDGSFGDGLALPPKKPSESVRLPLNAARMRAGERRLDERVETWIQPMEASAAKTERPSAPVGDRGLEICAPAGRARGKERTGPLAREITSSPSKANGADVVGRAALSALNGKPTMASPQSAYRSSSELKSAKYAPPQPSPLVRRALASQLPGNLRVTFISLVEASKQGPDLWASTFAVSVQAGGKEGKHSYRTVQRHLDQLERLKVLKRKHDANSYVSGFGLRRTATYVLHPEAEKKLSPRESYSQWRARNRRTAPSRFRPQRVPSAVEPTPAATPAPTAPALPPAQEHESCRSSHRRQLRQLTSREGRQLVAKMAQLMRGCHGTYSGPEGLRTVSPGHRDYRAPMSQENALTAACMSLGIPHESAVDHLKLCRWKFEESEDGPAP